MLVSDPIKAASSLYTVTKMVASMSCESKAKVD